MFLHDFNNIKMRIRWTIFSEENLNLIDGVYLYFDIQYKGEKKAKIISGIEGFRCQIVPKFCFQFEISLFYYMLFLVILNSALFSIFYIKTLIKDKITKIEV